MKVMLFLPTMRAAHENELMRVELGGDAVGDGSVAWRTEYVLSVNAVGNAEGQQCDADTNPAAERYGANRHVRVDASRSKTLPPLRRQLQRL